ncbi:MAG: AAA family ATPase [Candidatus Limivicinus sp.]|jgi:nitric oxide reductase NorQ protein
MLDFLRNAGINESIIEKVEDFRRQYPVDEKFAYRVPKPKYKYYGNDVWEKALTALIAGENILLVGPKATGKNVLAENLAATFNRPQWDISFYLNTDAASLIGTDTFKNGEVSLRRGPVYQCAEEGGFGVLDEINMAKNESLSVLHATLDFRRIIDVPGYDRIQLAPCTRFIATMNYGYAGTREINEALASRFMVINMPIISEEDLKRLLKGQFRNLKDEFAEQLVELFQEIRQKCDSSEISTKALDLRGLMASLNLVANGLTLGQALEMGIVNKSFDDFERQLVADIIAARVSADIGRETIFNS